MATTTDVAIIGAGPYGLSIAAYLQTLGLDYRICGKPMHFWAAQMPKCMLLKSEGFASNLYDPEHNYTLERFCKEKAIEYANLGVPVRLETFVSYGLSFQSQFVPALEEKALVSLGQIPEGFLLHLDSGESFTSRRIVIATGLSHFQHTPMQLAYLPPELMSHSSSLGDPDRFKGRNVAIIGGGASAIDLAVLLQESGAAVHLITRRSLVFHERMQLPRPSWDEIRHPLSGIGPGWRSLFYAAAPLLFSYLPEARRLRIAQNYLGPAGGWFMKQRFAQVPLLTGYQLKQVEITGEEVQLHFVRDPGMQRTLVANHVIAATGYKADLQQLPFLSPNLLSQIRSVQNTPVLSRTFESSVPGLYFVGPIAANTFGPVMRFAVGAKFAAPQVAYRLAASRSPSLGRKAAETHGNSCDSPVLEKD